MDKPLELLEEPIEPLNIVEPLVFNDALDCSAIQNVLLIDSSITQSQLFYDSANENTFPILYSNSSKKEELLAVLNNKFSNGFSRLAIVFHDPGYNNVKPFLDNSCLFVESDLETPTSYSENTAFLMELLQSKNVKNVDFLACNTLSYSKWKQYYELLQSNTECIVGASNDKTGNLQYGADWVMESTGQNVETMYFTNEIQEYSSTLAATSISSSGDIQIRQTAATALLEYSTDNGTTWTPIPSTDYPINITNSNTDTTVINVKFTTNITFSSAIGTNAYFVPSSNNITFDGQNYTVTISSITGYLGLIKNGTNTAGSGKSNISVQNIKTTSNSSTLAGSGGWVCQMYFGSYGSNNIITNCSNAGSITSDYSGGICGYGAGYSGSCSLTNCSNTGSITGQHAGGICGAYAGRSGTCTVSNCSNTGSITGSYYAGGICGGSAGYYGTKCEVSNCSNTGSINVGGAGGICGYAAGRSGSITVTNCSNTATINGDGAGGICGVNAGFFGTKCEVSKCSNTGLISGQYAGGITGAEAGNYGTCSVTNCFNTGSITGQYAGGITGDWFGYIAASDCSITNCYNIGSISGSNAGGIVGAEIGLKTSKTITISQCYNLGSIGTTCGGICGGTEGGTYNPSPTVRITNCYNAGTYTTNGTNYFIANSLQIKNSINSNSTNNYYVNGITVNGITNWSDSNANTALSNTPTNTYTQGSVWISRATNTPYLLSAFNSDIYNPSVSNSLAIDTASVPSVFGNSYSYYIVSILVTQGSNSATSYDNTAGKISIDNTSNTRGAITFANNVSSYTAKYQVNVLVYKSLSDGLYYAYNYNSYTVNSVSCFNYGTKILCLNQNFEEKYIPVQELKRGSIVKSYLHGYRRIDCIGKNRMLNEPTHKTNCMFKMEKTESNGLIEDLIVTGGHGIMVDELTEEQSNSQLELGFVQEVDHKKLLLVCNSDDFKPMENNDVYTYYHFTLENEGDDSLRYGVWANGLLMETPNKEGFETIPFERV